jgi:3-oxoadipate enol-lactonase
MSGQTCVDFAPTYPHLVDGLVLVTCAPSGFEGVSDQGPPQWDEMVAAFQAKDFERASELEVQIWVDGPHRSPQQVASAIWFER